MRLVVDFAGLEQTSHGSGEAGAVDPSLSRGVLSCKQGRRVSGTETAAHIPVFCGAAAQQHRESSPGFTSSGGAMERALAGEGEKKAVLVAKDDAMGDGAVFVLLEDDLARVATRLSPRLWFDAFHVEARAHGVVPLGVA